MLQYVSVLESFTLSLYLKRKMPNKKKPEYIQKSRLGQNKIGALADKVRLEMLAG